MIAVSCRHLVITLLVVASWAYSANAFHVALPTRIVAGVGARTASAEAAGPLFIFNKNKKEEEDLSYIETRDMTREEMQQLNKKNEDIMNAELIGMTLFSLVISVPMLYLVWVAFFSETAGVEDF